MKTDHTSFRSAVAIIATIILGQIGHPPEVAAGTMAFDPTPGAVVPLGTIDVHLVVDENTSGIHCFRTLIDFDRAALTLVSITEGPLLKAEGNTFFFWKDTLGVYDLFNCLLGPGLAADGPGVLATLRFADNGTTCATGLEFNYVLVEDSLLDSLAVGWVNGLVVVSGCCQCDHQGDLDGNGFTDAVDLALAIDIVFFGGTDVTDAGCPVSRTDLDAKQAADAVDLAWLIDLVFFGGSPGVDPCAP